MLNNSGNRFGEGLAQALTGNVANNRFTLKIEEQIAPISVLQVESEEQLNQPWLYRIIFTSPNKALSVNSILNQNASFSFNLMVNKLINKTIPALDNLALDDESRTIYGIITEFSQLSISKDEAHYQVILSPRLVKLSHDNNYAIFQNQSVVNVVETVLRSHGFTGIDYRLELNNTYPSREIITQWNETDLAFIQRILADVGIWFRFETHEQYNCDVLVLSDDEQGYAIGKYLDYKQPSGTLDGEIESIWDMTYHSQVVNKAVKVNDYNYRGSGSLKREINTQPNDQTTYGIDYRYGEHYKHAGNGVNNDNENIESGLWYAKIRHENAISHQIIINGKSNCHNLLPGQHIYVKGCPLSIINDGVIILSIQGRGNRTDAYELAFTAIPYQVFKPYRPNPIDWPQISGTLPARVTSPDNDTYGYIDTLGRYRVKFNFDLKNWKKGEESLWLRLAKPYTGSYYGFHFPLIDGAEVAIAFMNGNPDRPYIAHAMHDSNHPDHVTTENKHRNVIRTPANNKLRMDDKRGKEHIKLATEYGKTQLNLGHLVNNQKEQRGEGFELRTDEWGAIAAAKGLYLTTQIEQNAQGKQLDMPSAITQLENALSIAQVLKDVAIHSNAHTMDIDNQNYLKTVLTQLTQSGILAYAQEGIALTSQENIQLSTNNSLTITSENQTDLLAQKNVTLSSGEAMGLFAHQSGMKIFANQGDISVQSQNDNLTMASKQDMTIDSVDGNTIITAKDNMTLICGDSYIKINSTGIELGSNGIVNTKCNALLKMGPANMNVNTKLAPICSGVQQDSANQHAIFVERK